MCMRSMSLPIRIAHRLLLDSRIRTEVWLLLTSCWYFRSNPGIHANQSPSIERFGFSEIVFCSGGHIPSSSVATWWEQSGLRLVELLRNAIEDAIDERYRLRSREPSRDFQSFIDYNWLRSLRKSNKLSYPTA